MNDLICLIAALLSLAASQQPVFRSAAQTVTVNASIMRGNNPVPGLTAADLRLADNGVPQRIESIGFEAVPVDVTLFIDNSGSTHSVADTIKRDTNRILQMLRPGDRFRLLAFGFQVRALTPWLDAGTTVDLAPLGQSRISSVFDALFFSLMHRPETGRRHLAVAITDAADFASIVSLDDLKRVASRADGVLHVMIVRGGGSLEPNAPSRWISGGGSSAASMMDSLAKATGGMAHERMFGDVVVDGFKRAFDDFRLSYVLTFTPTGVDATGYHALTLEYPAQPRATIRARKGYWADQH